MSEYATKEEVDFLVDEVKSVKRISRQLATNLNVHIENWTKGTADLAGSVEALSVKIGSLTTALTDVTGRVSGVEGLTEAVQDLATFGRVAGNILKWITILGIFASAIVAVVIGL